MTWQLYMRLAGFSTVLLFNNFSSDCFCAILNIFCMTNWKFDGRFGIALKFTEFMRSRIHG